MTTMAEAIQSFVEESGGKVSSNQIKQAINDRHPDQWKHSTLQAHLYACVVNNPKAYIHHPSTQKFLYKNSDGTFEMYKEDIHGPNEWAPVPGDDEPSSRGDLLEASISLERDIEDHLVSNLSSIEDGLEFIKRQASNDAGRIDILAKDQQGQDVIIEIKVGSANDSSVGQVARYVGWYKKTQGRKVRAFLVASDFPEAVCYAAEAIPELTLISYKVSFSFERVFI